MKRILPYSLWLGNAQDCRDRTVIAEAGIQALVQLAIEETAPPLLRDVCFFRIPLSDGRGNDRELLKLAIQCIRDLLRAELPTLVCCSAGMSRSPAVSACAVACLTSRRPEECLKHVSKTISADVSPGLWNDLLALWTEFV